ncbi:MAG: hypothetical protein KatS3mg010_0352 [Acidimicrobiia bacterium]|nr:MAG: hypothetical protein KatS3mg010_0352 [Acidimicrobiia bacterium]
MTGWPDAVPDRGTLLLLADPFSFPVPDVLRVCNEAAPGLTVVGGLASSAVGPGGKPARVSRRPGHEHRWCRRPVDGEEVPGTRGRVAGLPPDRPAAHRDAGRAEPRLRARGPAGGAAPPGPRRRRRRRRSATSCARGCTSASSSTSTSPTSGAATSSCATSSAPTAARGALAVGEVVDVGQTVQFHVRDAGAADEGPPAPARRRRRRRGTAVHLQRPGAGAVRRPRPTTAGAVEDALGAVPLAGAFWRGRDRARSAAGISCTVSPRASRCSAPDRGTRAA